MDSLTLASELKRFFKENRLTIALITLLTIVTVTGLAFIASRPTSIETEQDNNLNAEIGTPAIFQFYVQTEDGNSFSNSAVVEEFFLQPEVISEIEEKTGVSIMPALEEQYLSGFQKTPTDRGILGVMRDGSSHVFTANASLGTEEENLAVMEAYFDYLNAENIPVLQDKDVYILKKPTNLKLLMDMDEGREIKFNPKNLVLAGVVGLFGGLIAGIMIALIYQLLRKVITYAFSFGWDEADIYQRLSKGDTHAVKQTVLHPFTETKVILAQHTEVVDLSEMAIHEKVNVVTELGQFKLGAMNIVAVSDLSELDPLLHIEECIIYVESGKTEKKWYEKQRMQLKNYGTRIKIIQFV